MQHYLPIIFAIIFVVVRMIASAAGQANRKPPPTQPKQPGTTRINTPDAAQIEQERLRRFREAVGLPVDLPTPVQPRTVTRPLAPVSPPANLPTTGRLRRVPPAQPVSPPPLSPAVPPVISPLAPAQPAPAPASIMPAFQPYVAPVIAPLGKLNQTAPTVAAPQPAPAMQTGELLARLRDPASIRQAIVLREVLGPPRAYQEFGTAWMGPLGLASKNRAKAA